MTKEQQVIEALQAALEWCEQDATNEDGYPTQEMFDARIEVVREALAPVKPMTDLERAHYHYDLAQEALTEAQDAVKGARREFDKAIAREGRRQAGIS